MNAAGVALVRAGRSGDARSCAPGRRDRDRQRAAPVRAGRGLAAAGGRRAQGADREHAARPRAAEMDRSSRASRCRTTSSAAATAQRAQTEIWIESMRAVAAEGIRTICYNVMPVVDWTRTDLDYPMPTGATALRFDYDRFAAFDLHVLKRKGAEADYDEATRARARKVADGAVAERSRTADQEHRRRAARRDDVLGQSRRIPRAHRLLRRHHAGQDARQCGGVPRKGDAGRRTARRAAHACIRTIRRVRSSACRASPRPRADYEALFKAVPSQANGICFCVGSLGSRARTTTWWRWRRISAPRIYFAHLRATRIDDSGRSISFTESDHLDGDVNMVDVLRVMVAENASATTPGASRSVPITATACSTTSRRRASIRATPASAGSRASPNCAARSARCNDAASTASPSSGSAWR